MSIQFTSKICFFAPALIFYIRVVKRGKLNLRKNFSKNTKVFYAFADIIYEEKASCQITDSPIPSNKVGFALKKTYVLIVLICV